MRVQGNKSNVKPIRYTDDFDNKKPSAVQNCLNSVRTLGMVRLAALKLYAIPHKYYIFE